jgi:hypothetical protein
MGTVMNDNGDGFTNAEEPPSGTSVISFLNECIVVRCSHVDNAEQCVPVFHTCNIENMIRSINQLRFVMTRMIDCNRWSVANRTVVFEVIVIVDFDEYD